MIGVAAADADAVTDETGPVYGTEDREADDAPMPRLIVFVVADGIAEDKLVVYDELGCAPAGI